MWKVSSDRYRQNMWKEEGALFKVEASRKAPFVRSVHLLRSPGKPLKLTDARVSPQLEESESHGEELSISNL